MAHTQFYICRHCGNIITKIKDSGVKVVCCGEDMQELIPNTTDGAKEKHVPVVTVENKKITVVVGSVPHPMLQEHYIQWIFLETKKGIQMKKLQPDEKPEASFALTDDDELVAVYEYCNLHGLWKLDL